MELPAPLAARVQPIPGESLLSLVARAAHANVFPRLTSLLAEAGVGGHPAFAPFTAGDQVDALAALLGVDPDEVAGRMHLPMRQAQKGVVGWSGARMERRWIEARARRVSPASLSASAHHRLEWTHRALSFCPESFELLLERCPACSHDLGWTATHGLDRCERCKASLLEADTRYVDPQLQARLHLACQLISPEAAMRQRAQSKLPAEFQTWDAGELFSALLELGVAFERPDEGRASATAAALREGRLGLVRPGDIARGHEVLQGWPDSYGELVGRIWQARTDQGGSMALRDLGVLGRWFDNRAPDCAFRRLLRDGVAAAAEAGAMPLKRRADAARAASPSTLTLTEASQRFDVSKATLVRLIPQGACLASGKRGRGGAVRLDRHRLTRAIELYRRSLRPSDLAAKLGVPAYCLPAFVEAGLIEMIDDGDAKRLAGQPLLYDRRSLDSLFGEIAVHADPTFSFGQRLSSMMGGKYHPRHWTRVFEGLASGQLEHEPIQDEPQQRGFSRQVTVGPSELSRWWASVPEPGWPPDAQVSAGEAGLLLGMAAIYVPELIGARLLPARKAGRGWRIGLYDLIAFDETYHLAAELRAQGERPRTYARAVQPLLSTRHLRVWRREAAADARA